MTALASIFFDFNLPNATTWFYFALLLAVALFFKFSRLLSMRNWDVVTLFLLVPGLLMLQESRHNSAAAVARVADGVVVGTALVDATADALAQTRDPAAKVLETAAALAKAVRTARATATGAV